MWDGVWCLSTFVCPPQSLVKHIRGVVAAERLLQQGSLGRGGQVQEGVQQSQRQQGQQQREAAVRRRQRLVASSLHERGAVHPGKRNPLCLIWGKFFQCNKRSKKSKVVKTLSSLSKKHKIKIFLGQFLQNCCTWEFNKNPNLPQKASSSYLENNFRTTCILMLPVLSSSAPSTLWWHHLWFIQNIVSYAPLSVRALSGTGGNPPLSSMTCCATTTWKSTAETQQHIWVYLWHTVFWQIQRGLSYEICYVTVPNHFTVKSHLAAVRDYSMEELGWNSPVLQHIVLTGITSCVSFELSGKVIETESLIWSLFIFEAQIIWLLVL